jgi:hypothetical protein
VAVAGGGCGADDVSYNNNNNNNSNIMVLVWLPQLALPSPRRFPISSPCNLFVHFVGNMLDRQHELKPVTSGYQLCFGLQLPLSP